MAISRRPVTVLKVANINARASAGRLSMRDATSFSVLGPMTISNERDTVMLASSKPTILLAAMLLRPCEVVSAEFLQRVIWGDAAPDSARATLQTYILRLRQLFAKFGVAHDAIRTVPGGYC